MQKDMRVGCASSCMAPANPAVGMDLHSQGLDVVCPVCAASEIRQVELDLVPALCNTTWRGLFASSLAKHVLCESALIFCIL